MATATAMPAAGTKLTGLKVLAHYFNEGDGVSVESAGGDNVPATVAGVPSKRTITVFAAELKKFNDTEKRELAAQVAETMGWVLA